MIDAMASYNAAQGKDRWKAIVAVAAVHVALAAIIVTGLDGGRIASHVADQMKVFDWTVPPPPPPPPPPLPAPTPTKAKLPEGAPAKKAEPTPVVAPPSPRSSPVVAAKVAGKGSSSASGASIAGNGTGAGGSGNGAGGGGSADYSRFTPAQLIRNLTRGDYRSIGAGRLPNGRAMVSLKVETSGAPSGCRITRSSGDPVVDSGLCPLIEGRLRFRPALDDRGRPVPYQLQYVATWSL